MKESMGKSGIQYMVFSPMLLVNDMNQGLFFVVANKLLLARILGRALSADWKEELLASYIGLLFYHQIVTPWHDNHHPILRRIYKILTVIGFNWLLTGDLSISGIAASTVTLIVFALFDKWLTRVLGQITGNPSATKGLRESIDTIVVLSLEDTPLIDAICAVAMTIIYHTFISGIY
jgi:hypothetical protein